MLSTTHATNTLMSTNMIHRMNTTKKRGAACVTLFKFRVGARVRGRGRGRG